MGTYYIGLYLKPVRLAVYIPPTSVVTEEDEYNGDKDEDKNNSQHNTHCEKKLHIYCYLLNKDNNIIKAVYYADDLTQVI